jgi:hypothetical protein
VNTPFARRFSIPLVVVLSGCAPDLPKPDGEAPSAPVELGIVPEAPLDAAPPVLWLRLRGAGEAGIPGDDAVLAEGKLGPSSLDDLAAGQPSDALLERLVPSTVLVDGEDLVLIPHAALPDGRYAVGATNAGLAWELSVHASGARVLERVWPPHGRSASSWVAVYCGADPLGPIDEPVVLVPAGPTGRLVRGTPSGAARSCVRFLPERVSGVSASAVMHVPPAIGADAERVYLDPFPIALAPGEPMPTDLVACEVGEIALGPGCARVMDDRALVRTPEAPVFWAIRGDGVDAVESTRNGATFTLRGLTPSSSVPVTVESLGLEGVFVSTAIVLRTAPPMPHAVITEVYADAVGPEPASEWVELVNDGLAPLSLAGFTLGDIGGETLLPEAVLAPGQLALVVGEDFVGDGEYDVAPAPGTLLVRVPRVGKNGLGNQGEPLKLVDPSGVVLSRFPAEPKPKSGKSVARVTPDAADTSDSGFFIADPPTPGAPNAPPP